MSRNPNAYVPKKCVFEATLACNLRCRHCGSRAGQKRPNELDTGEAEDLFTQLSELGCRFITISGGEPMMRDDWFHLIKFAARTGMRVGMITNAVAFDRDAALLAKDNGLGAVGFSLDGTHRVHDTIRGRVGHFGRLMGAMDAAAEVGLPFSVVSFLNSLNIDALEEMYTLISEKGAYAWQVQLGTDMGNLSDNRDLLVNPRALPKLQATLAGLIKRNGLRIDVSDSIGYYGQHEKTLRTTAGGKGFRGCGAGLRVIGIESNGNVKGCLSMMAGYNKQGADFVEGNIREERLEDIWFKEGAFSYNREWSLDSLAGFCRECKHATRCRGGCRAKMVASGSGVQNPLCAYRVACESQQPRRVGQAAAVVLASLLGTQACIDDGDTEPEDAGESDNGDTASDTSIATDVETDFPAYGIPDTDTDFELDTTTPTDMDSDVTDYGTPDYVFEPDSK